MAARVWCGLARTLAAAVLVRVRPFRPALPPDVNKPWRRHLGVQGVAADLAPQPREAPTVRRRGTRRSPRPARRPSADNRGDYKGRPYQAFNDAPNPSDR